MLKAKKSTKEIKTQTKAQGTQIREKDQRTWISGWLILGVGVLLLLKQIAGISLGDVWPFVFVVLGIAILWNQLR